MGMERQRFDIIERYLHAHTRTARPTYDSQPKKRSLERERQASARRCVGDVNN